jgi:hypothetical protein
MTVSILPARSRADIAAVAGLMRAYAAALDVGLAFQEIDTELATLPGKYAPPPANCSSPVTTMRSPSAVSRRARCPAPKAPAR